VAGCYDKLSGLANRFGGLAYWRGEAVLNRADAEILDQVSRGRLVYNGNCASCHGDNLQGQPNWRERKPDGRLPAPPHDDTGHSWHRADEQLFRITKNGAKPPLAPEGYESDMPAFAETLSDEEMWAERVRGPRNRALTKSRLTKRIDSKPKNNDPRNRPP